MIVSSVGHFVEIPTYVMVELIAARKVVETVIRKTIANTAVNVNQMHPNGVMIAICV